jgi:hypothetical protein
MYQCQRPEVNTLETEHGVLQDLDVWSERKVLRRW